MFPKDVGCLCFPHNLNCNASGYATIKINISKFRKSLRFSRKKLQADIAASPSRHSGLANLLYVHSEIGGKE
jgi:hypothetical protein